GICSPIFTNYLPGRGSHMSVRGVRPAPIARRRPGRRSICTRRGSWLSLPVVQALTLVTSDGVPIDAAHLPGRTDLAVVLAHGFTLSWQRPAIWRVATRLNKVGGVVIFDFRG